MKPGQRAKHRAAMDKRSGANNPRAKVLQIFSGDRCYRMSINESAKFLDRCPKVIRSILSGKAVNTTDYAIAYNGKGYPANQAQRRNSSDVMLIAPASSALVYRGSSRGAAAYLGLSINAVQFITRHNRVNNTGHIVMRDGLAFHPNTRGGVPYNS